MNVKTKELIHSKKEELFQQIIDDVSVSELEAFKRHIFREYEGLHRHLEYRKNFKVTDENIQKIIDMNDGLHKRFRMIYDDMLAMKQKIDADIKKGTVQCSGYTIFPEYFFAYNYDEKGIPTADGDTLKDLSDATTYLFPSFELTEDSTIPDFEKDFLMHDELSWNIEDLALPGLENHYIYYFMHTIFVDSDTFCVADIQYLKPEDLQWQITVQYEQFNR